MFLPHNRRLWSRECRSNPLTSVACKSSDLAFAVVVEPLIRAAAKHTPSLVWSSQQLQQLRPLRRLEGVKCNIWAISELYLLFILSPNLLPAFIIAFLVFGCFLLFPWHTTEGLTTIISHLCCSIFIFAAFKHSTQPPPSLLPNAGIRE